MRKILAILLLFASLTAGATKYYIATTGTDGEWISGAIGAPWLTLDYACTRATTAGDTIMVGAGTFTETATANLSEGVSIYGAGATSIITSSAALEPLLSLISGAEGANGNQSISHLTFDGNLTAEQAILTRGRSNIKLHDVTIIDFLGEGTNVVIFNGRVSGSTEPTTYATGIEIYNCTFTNNGDDFEYSANVWFAYAAVEIVGTSGALVHDNLFDNKTGGRYGYGLKCISGYIRGAKIYDNEFYLTLHDGSGLSSYAFAVELWNGTGGVEVYRNYCNGGGIDLAGRGWDDKYDYGYAAKIYGNTVVMDAQPIYTAESALLFESGSADGIHFYKNYVKNFTTGFSLSLRLDSDTRILNVDGLYIYNNVFDRLGRSNSTAPGWGINFNIVNSTAGAYAPEVNDFRVLNNVIYHPVLQAYGLLLTATTGGAGATWTNVTVANNIFYKMYWPCQWTNQTIDTITTSNNIFFDSEDATMFVTCTVTNDDNEAGTDVDPLFISNTDFHLQSTSPARDAGIDVSAITGGTDFHGAKLYGAAYDIGAFEHGLNRMMILNGTTMPTINYKTVLIDH